MDKKDIEKLKVQGSLEIVETAIRSKLWDISYTVENIKNNKKSIKVGLEEIFSIADDIKKLNVEKIELMEKLKNQTIEGE